MPKVTKPQVDESAATGDLLSPVLRTLLKNHQCVAYVGAGFSMACGMPDWKGLLGRLLEKAWASLDGGVGNDERRRKIDCAARAVNHGEYDRAAHLLKKDILSEVEVNRTMQELFANDVFHRANASQKQQMKVRMDSLVCGPWAGIVTTNYDKIIETAISSNNSRYELSDADINRLGIILAQPFNSSFFVKLHGSISGERPVLTTSDYDRLYLKAPNVVAFLTALMLRYHVVFIGCSLTDEVIRLRRTLALHFDNYIPTAYGLLPESENNRDHKAWLAEVAQIQVTLYDAGDTAHRAVDRFLAEIATC
jgi:hypothetical protein